MQDILTEQNVHDYTFAQFAPDLWQTGALTESIPGGEILELDIAPDPCRPWKLRLFIMD